MNRKKRKNNISKIILIIVIILVILLVVLKVVGFPKNTSSKTKEHLMPKLNDITEVNKQ